MFGLFKNKWKERAREEARMAERFRSERFNWAHKYFKAKRALAAIAALETPNAAHGVKKAVRIAKGALEQ